MCTVVETNGVLKLCIFALTDIHAGVELRYDYGDPDLIWRKQVCETKLLTLKLYIALTVCDPIQLIQ